MIDASIKQAMKEARQKRKQEDKARIDAQHEVCWLCRACITSEDRQAAKA
jgi:hypothetical protein